MLEPAVIFLVFSALGVFQAAPSVTTGDAGEFASGVTGSEKWEGFEKMVSSLEGRVEWQTDQAGFAMGFPRGSV